MGGGVVNGPDVEGVLGRHVPWGDGDGSSAIECGLGCGVYDDGRSFMAHVAAAVRAEVRAWLESEGAKLQATVTLLAGGAGPGSSLRSWRCEHPDRYGECDCVTETAGEVLAALAEQVGRVASVGEGEG
jgi:hypothetical protein